MLLNLPLVSAKSFFFFFFVKQKKCVRVVWLVHSFANFVIFFSPAHSISIETTGCLFWWMIYRLASPWLNILLVSSLGWQSVSLTASGWRRHPPIFTPQAFTPLFYLHFSLPRPPPGPLQYQFDTDGADYFYFYGVEWQSESISYPRNPLRVPTLIKRKSLLKYYRLIKI